MEQYLRQRCLSCEISAISVLTLADQFSLVGKSKPSRGLVAFPGYVQPLPQLLRLHIADIIITLFAHPADAAEDESPVVERFELNPINCNKGVVMGPQATAPESNETSDQSSEQGQQLTAAGEFLACQSCRNRKLKCSHEIPSCSQCLRLGKFIISAAV